MARWLRCTARGFLLLSGMYVSASIRLPQAAAQATPDGGVRLSWVRDAASEGCLDAVGLERDVSKRLGRNPFREPATQQLEGVVRRSPSGGFTAELYDRDAKGRLSGARELTSESSDCAALCAAVALAMALAIDPDAALAPPVGQGVGGPGRETARSEADSAPGSAEGMPVRTDNPRAGPSAPSPRTQARRESAVRVALGALGSYRLVPGTAPGVSFDVDARLWGPLRAAMGTLYVPEQRSDKTGAAFGFSVTAARIGLCAATSRERFMLAGCAGLLLGAIQAVVFRPNPTHPGERFFGAADVRVEGAWLVFDPLFLALSAGIAVPFVRHRFRLEERKAPEFQQVPVIPLVTLAAGLRFL